MRCFVVLSLLLCGVRPGIANASDAPAPNDRSAPRAALAWEVEPDAGLEARRGGFELVDGSVALVDVSAQVSENHVGAGAETGVIALSGSAVSDVRGIFVATFNTGNNSSVQTQLNVIVRLD